MCHLGYIELSQQSVNLTVSFCSYKPLNKSEIDIYSNNLNY